MEFFKKTEALSWIPSCRLAMRQFWLMSLLGATMASGGFIYAGIVVVGRLTGWVVAGTGYAALMTVLLVGQGLILLMLGMLGEYLWRTFDEARGRPRYIVEEAINCQTRGTPSVDHHNEVEKPPV